jgi:VWFA-related protein
MRGYWLSPLLSGMLAIAQTAPDSTAPTITFQTGATNVIVDVVVTGPRDQPVEGLTKENFTLLEDGHEQPLVSFESHPSATPASSQSAPAPAVAPGVFTNQPAALGNDAVDVLLIDALNTPIEKQLNTRKALIDYLKTMPANKPMAVFTLDRHLEQLEDFTTDHTALLNAVESFTHAAHSSPALKTNADTERQMQDEDSAMELYSLAGHAGLGRAEVKRLQQFNAESDSFNDAVRAELTMGALGQLARYLSAIPGRKNLLWLSGSFPLAVLPDYYLKDPSKPDKDFSAKVDQTASLLAKSRIAVYPIDARGLYQQSYNNPVMSGGNMFRQPDRKDAAEAAENSQHAEEHLTLEEAARNTGGEVIANTNDLKGALAEVDRAGAHYYTLVYSPTNNAQNDVTRRIEVRVHPGKYTLLYRHSYVPVKPANSQMLAQFMEHKVPSSGQILFRLSPTSLGVQPESAALAGSNPKAPRPVTRYSIEYDVDVAPLQLSAAQDGVLQGRTTLVVIAYDRDGRPLNSTSNTLNLRVPPAQYSTFLKQGIHYRQQLDIPAQAAWLRAGVVDHTSGSIGSLEVPFSVSQTHPTH